MGLQLYSQTSECELLKPAQGLDFQDRTCKHSIQSSGAKNAADVVQKMFQVLVYEQIANQAPPFSPFKRWLGQHQRALGPQHVFGGNQTRPMEAP